MKTFRLKTHKLENTYTGLHFFALNKELNSEKPLNASYPNCFICLTQNQVDRDSLFWLYFGLWRPTSFHFCLKGPVIPFSTIYEIRKVIRENETNASTKLEAFNKAIQTLKFLGINEQKIKTSLKMINIMKQGIFHELMKESGTG